MLYIVPTPIGNLKDISYRAVEVLRKADLVLCEDTRVSRKLLSHYEISSTYQSYHAHNEHKKADYYINLLMQGQEIALISDAGTPAISDPGFLIIRRCREEGIPVSCLPGATAFVPALVMSGLPSDKFYFEGFLPVKKGRQKRLKFLSGLDCTIIIYESPHRLERSLRDLIEHFGEDCKAAVVKEISKIHERLWQDSLANLMLQSEHMTPKGEYVMMVSPQLLDKN